MLSNSVRNEGTNVLKEISSMNRKSNNAVQYGLSTKKPKTASQTYGMLANSSKINNKITQKASTSTLQKPSGLFFYPSHVPIQISDEKLNEISAKNQPLSSSRPQTQSAKQLNTSALLSKQNSYNVSGRQTRTTMTKTPSNLLDSSHLTNERSAERSQSPEYKTTPTRQLNLETGTKTPTSRSNNTSQIISPENTRLITKNSSQGVIKVSPKIESVSLSPPKSEKIRKSSRSQDEQKLTTVLPYLYIPGGGLKSRSQANSGRTTPKHSSQTPIANFEFCKNSNEESSRKVTEPKAREITPKETSPPKSGILKTESKSNIIEKKTSSIKTQPSVTTKTKTASISISKAQSYQQIVTPSSQRTDMYKTTTSYKKALTKPIEIEKPTNPFNTAKMASVTPQNKSTTELGIKTKLLKTEPKKEKPKEPEKPKAPTMSEKKLSMLQLLSDEERGLYGDRFPIGFSKEDFLGRGGFALVWLGVNKTSGKKFAIKQIVKSATDESQEKELKYGRLFFKDGQPQEKFKDYPGIEHIAAMVEFKHTKSDFWHIFELGGATLSKLIFDIKGEFYKGERIYGVRHLDLHKQFRTDGRSLKAFIKQIAESLMLLSDHKVVHCDLKPDNILINLNSQPEDKYFDLKIIDFGSAYNWSSEGNVGMATPEYMPPEFLHVLCTPPGNGSSIKYLAGMSKPWSNDVWSLGAILLEIITGVPLWLSLKCRVELKGKDHIKTGLFAVKGRTYDKIFIKQRTVMESFGEVMSEYLGDWNEPEVLYDLLTKMMKWNPSERISPREILEHPYVASINEEVAQINTA